MNEVKFQKAIKYKFNDIQLLKTALTHSSYVNEFKNDRAHHNKDEQNNERLEFLGDAIFDAVISDELYKKLWDVEEGVLTKLRASIVCERSLARCAKSLSLGKLISLGKGEENSGGRSRNSILADAMEAVIGAVYLDGGFEAAKSFVLSIFGSIIEDALNGKLYKDYKTDIQEILQARGEADIRYIIEKEEGPDHNKTFYVNLLFNGKVIGNGCGRTKKEAEQNAAKEGIERGEVLVF
ncbi:ribonuclease III [Anaerovorax odorimutans]|uniref:ribonuclease III n=1 Tax=Anaerovorax odorimutans TaxID=109327 RepID=UPI00042A3C6A|nr:ribonuclease III [Anaerovorax odorimutans]